MPDNGYTIPIGKAEVKKAGSDITLISYGLAIHYGLEAATLLEDDDVSVEVLDLRTLRPLDKETILESVRKTGKALIVHEASVTGGVGAEVSAIISEEAFEYLDAPVTRLCGPDLPAMPFAPTLEDGFMVNTEKITDALLKLAAY